MHVGHRIEKLMDRKNWSQKQLAEKVKINTSVLNRIIKGTRPVRDDELKAFSNVLDTTTDYLLGRDINELNNNIKNKRDPLDEEVEKSLKDPETQLFFKDYASAPEEKKAQARNFLKYLLQDEEKKNNS